MISRTIQTYREISKRIAKQCRKQGNGAFEVTELGKKLLIERARIVAGASGKIELLRDLIEIEKNNIINKDPSDTIVENIRKYIEKVVDGKC